VIPDHERPNDATLTEWIRHCKRAGLYEQGKLLYEKGGLNPDNLANRRRDGCFPTLEDLRGSLGDATYDKVKNSVAESSNYFRATVWVTIGTTEFTLYSLLARGGTGTVRPALRSFGSD
jgi:hypothetical protein